MIPFLSVQSARVRTALVVALVAWPALSSGGETDLRPEDPTGKVTQDLRNRLSHPAREERSFCRKETLCGQAVLSRFYEQRGFAPAWAGPECRFELARDLVATLREAPLEGLRLNAYHLGTIETLLPAVDEERAAGRPVDPELLADLDLLLTDAFLIYGSHLLSGRVDPETVHTRWIVRSREQDLADVLGAALKKKQVSGALKGLLPGHPGYAALRQALLKHRAIAGQGGWPSVPGGAVLHEEDRDPRVAALRARLAVSGDLGDHSATDPEIVDEALVGAVQRFQYRHGLIVDGVVGPATLAALNVPAEGRVRQIELNMERWRWLPEDLGTRYILVNTAAFSLEVIDRGERVLAMRVVAGRTARRTPLLSGDMSYLVLNPYWHIPHKLAVRDILPEVKKDPGYLARQGIRVFESWDESAPEVPLEGIDWSRVTGQNLAFKFRQDAGPRNALGRVKFMFPNKFAVYLHDTPSRYMFARNRRDFSSGCIRVEKPIDLAALALEGDPKWTREAILSAIEEGTNRTVWLPEAIPVHVLYWTAWVDRDGRVCFRRDVYGRDPPLARALEEGPRRYQ